MTNQRSKKIKKDQKDDANYASLFDSERNDKFIKAHLDFFAELKKKGYLKEYYEKIIN